MEASSWGEDDGDCTSTDLCVFIAMLADIKGLQKVAALLTESRGRSSGGLDRFSPDE